MQLEMVFKRIVIFFLAITSYITMVGCKSGLCRRIAMANYRSGSMIVGYMMELQW